MKDLISLEVLSNIEGATSSEAVERLFDTIRKVAVEKIGVETVNLQSKNAISTEDLRDDIVVKASEVEKQIIIDNFPNKKDNYLVVPKVIEE